MAGSETERAGCPYRVQCLGALPPLFCHKFPSVDFNRPRFAQGNASRNVGGRIDGVVCWLPFQAATIFFGLLSK